MGRQMRRIGLKSALYVLCIATPLALTAMPPLAQQQYNRAGMLSCTMAPTIGLIIGSRQTMRCEFRPERGAPEFYSGVMSRIGLDLGITRSEEHTSEIQSLRHLVCRLLLEKK